jgi:hypothetical protein
MGWGCARQRTELWLDALERRRMKEGLKRKELKVRMDKCLSIEIVVEQI